MAGAPITCLGRHGFPALLRPLPPLLFFLSLLQSPAVAEAVEDVGITTVAGRSETNATETTTTTTARPSSREASAGAVSAAVDSVAWIGQAANSSSGLALLATGAGESAGYSGSEAAEFARVSAATYCERAGPEVRDARVIAARSELAVVGHRGGRCIVAFRGTDNLGNVFQDVESEWLAPMPDCGGCKVGAGFLRAYAGVAGGVKAALHELGCTRVAVTGHSLGAAVAILALYDLSRSGFEMQTSYTFGQPRIGNDAFHRAFSMALRSVSVYRLVHGEDPIVPLGPAGTRAHEGTEIYLPGASVDLDHSCYLGVAFKRRTLRGRVCGGPCNPYP